jgi:acetylornithine deacetylase/succinyl-diaminopimelate desuccinylase-like protein
VRSFAERGGLPVVPRLTFDGYTAEPVESFGTQLDEALQSAVVAAGLSPIDVGPSTGTSDMRHYVARGTPCLLYGPGAGFNPHRADEHYRLDDLPRIILTLLELARRWCSDPPS